MCRITFHSDTIVSPYSESCSDSDKVKVKVMAAEDILRVSYSRCPLKKRPVLLHQDKHESQDADEGVDFMGPKNLSMKPEDLRVKSKALIHPSTVTSRKTEFIDDCLKPKNSATLLRRYLQSCSLNPQTFENQTIQELNPSTCRSSDLLKKSQIPVHYYPDFEYQCLFSNEACGDYKHLGPSTERSHNGCQVNTMVSNSQEALNIQKCLSPNSPFTTSKPLSSHSICPSVSLRTPSPPMTPEDLSSPGSVASSGCCSTGSTCYTYINKETKHKRQHQCSLCLKFYSTHSGLAKHKCSHCNDNKESLNKKWFGCKICEKVYVSLGALKMHIRTHTLPCKCSICGKAFSRPWLLQGHIRTHTGEKPFSCPLCERPFADRSNLRAHLQTHSEVKKYSCSSCGKSFSRMSLLTKHHVRKGGAGSHSECL